MKDNLPWFKHYSASRNHPKMKALRGKFGPSGYGRFWMLNEIIAEAPDAKLDLSRQIYRLSAAQELGLEIADFESFIAFLSDPEIDLVNYIDGIVTTDQTQEDYSVVESGRSRKRVMGASSAEKRENSAEKTRNAAEFFNRAEQSRAEENRADGQTENLSSRDEPEDTDPPPAAALTSFSEEVYKTLFNSRFRSSFTATECVGISERLEAVGLDTGFVEYAIRKASDTRVRSPGGFLRQALSGAKGFEDWPEKYRAETDVQHPEGKQTKAPRPTTCDECGGKLRPTSSEAMCTSCGARWKYDGAFNIWQKVEEMEKCGSGS